MVTDEEAREINDKISAVDGRVSRLEGGYEHLATKSDMKDLENRLFVRLGLLIIVVGAAVAIVQRL